MYCPQIPFVPAPPLAALSRLPVNSGVAVFSAGRLGCIGRSKCGFACETTSDNAIEGMFDAAKHSIQLALQDMGPIIDTGVPLNWWLFGHRWVMIALCKALVRGVTVSIIQSGLKAMDSYGVGWTPSDVASMAMWYLNNGEQYGIKHDLNQTGIKTLVCKQMAVATVHYYPGEDGWATQGTLLAAEGLSASVAYV